MAFFKKKSFQLNVLTLSLLTAFNIHAAEPVPSNQKILDLIEAQQKELDALKAQLKQSEQRTEQKVEAVSTMVEKQQTTSPSWVTNSRFGGYGEMHYNNLKNDGAKGDLKEIDFHRFVLYFGHHFNDSIRFHSEVEYEHSLIGEGKPGELEIEQAYLDFDINPNLTIRGGLFILPIGMINETHEPNVFYGVERNPVENKIIPTTWWEGGVNIMGKVPTIAGLQYDLALHSGLAVPKDNYTIRSGRQKVASAKANNLATTTRLKYTGIKGLELATSLFYQNDISQELDPKAGSGLLWEAHADYQIQNFRIKGLYAHWKLDGEGPKATGKDKQYGWYIEPSYKISDQIGVFARYNEWDNGAAAGKESRYRQYDVGINYWAHPNVVIKADYQHQNGPAGSDLYKGFNLGLGYQFF